SGWTAAEVVGQICPYASLAANSAVESLTASLCPPPEALAGVEMNVPAYIVHKSGESHGRVIHFVPLRDDGDQVASVLGLILPIKSPHHAVAPTPMQQLHAELAALRATLRARFGEQTVVARSPAMA